MYFQKAILILSLSHVFAWAEAQDRCTSVFSGRVLGKDGAPLFGATVMLFPQQKGQATDAEGKFRFTGLCSANYQVRVQYIGYESSEFEILIEGETTRTISLVESVTVLHEIVIQHHDETHTEHATNFVQLEERQLAESAGKTLGEALRKLPGVNTIQTGPGIFKPVIHGVHSQRILILNHGLRQEGQQWGAEHAPEIDPFSASNVVVIKDASAIKYGTNALGGVIVVNPSALPQTDAFGGTVNTVFQTNGASGTSAAMLEGGLPNHTGWGWRVQGTVKRGGDFSTPDYNLTNTGIAELNYSLAAGYHVEKAGVDVFLSRYSATLGILKGTSVETKDDLFAAMERSIPAYTEEFSYHIGAPRQQVSHNLLKINGHLRTSMGEWRWQYGFQENHRQEFDLRIGDLSNTPAINLDLQTHSIDTEWEIHHADTRSATVGINLGYQQNRNVPGTHRIPFIPNFASSTSGIFAVAKWQFNSWQLDAGARYDYKKYDVKGFDFKNEYYSTAFDLGNLSATAGAIFALSANQTLKLNASSSWRPPHVAELFSLGKHQSAAAIEYGLMLNDSTNEVMNFEDSNFHVEQAAKFTATWQIRRKNLTVDVGPYANYIFNYIYLRAHGITRNIRGVYPYFRYDQTDALFLGADVAATWALHPHFKIIPQASLLRVSDVRHNDYLAFIPPNRYELVARYDNPAWLTFKNFYVESRVSYVAQQTRAPRVITAREIDDAMQAGNDPFPEGETNFDFMAPPPDYWIWNLSAGLSLKPGDVQYDFRISGDNVLNLKYRDYTNRFRYYADELGRNISLSFKCIF